MMNRRWVVVAALLVFLLAGQAFADQTAVSLEGPNEAINGSEVTIKINVVHKGNHFFHYTSEVVVQANGTEIARWEFSPWDKPEDEVFSREVKYMVTGPTEIIATGKCNIHGSAGPAVLKISVK